MKRILRCLNKANPGRMGSPRTCQAAVFEMLKVAAHPLALRAAVLLTLLLGTRMLAQDQTLGVFYQGNLITQNGKVYIDRDTVMPAMSMQVTGDCASVTYTITIDYLPQSTPEMTQSLSGSFPCAQTAVNWAGLSYVLGGNTTLSVQVTDSCGNLHQNSFPFVIAGQNPYPSQVNGNMPGAPWCFQGVIQVESSYRQFDSATSDKPIFYPPPMGMELPSLIPRPTTLTIGIGSRIWKTA